MQAMRYNEDKLNVVGHLFPPHAVYEGAPLLQVLDMLEDVDLIILGLTPVLRMGCYRGTWHNITKVKGPY